MQIIPAMPIADSSPPISRRNQQTSREISTATLGTDPDPA
jgi:hypothetical protein